MKKIIVIYKTKYGSTRQYAQWISEELGCKAVPLEEVKPAQLDSYDVIIYGGGIQGGGIRGFDQFKKWIKPFLKNGNTGGNSGKKIIIFSVGINNQEQECRMQLRDINFDKSYLKPLTCYCFTGAYDPSKIKGIDKIIMGVVRKMAGGKPQSEMTEAEKALLLHIDEGCNLVSKDQIEPLIEDVKESLVE